MPATVSLAMIVRDEQANLPACLESVGGLFDESVVVDTGSRDDTVKIARRSGARIFRFAWVDDFGAARNFGLDRCRGEFIFRMDADDRLPASQRKRLGRLLGGLDPIRPMAFAFRVHARQHDGTEATSDELRLWPNLPAIRFRGRIHERINPERDAPGIGIGPSHVRIDHAGYADGPTWERKLRRNLAILRADAARPPVDPLTHFDLGRTLSSLGAHDAALRSLEEFLRTKDPAHALAGRVAHRRIVEVHRDRDDLSAAMASVRRGLAEYPDDAVLVCMAADMLRHVGERDLAREGYERAIRLYKADRMDSGVAADFKGRLTTSLASVS